VVRHEKVDDLTADQIGEHVRRSHDQAPVEGEVATLRATTPARPLVADVNPARSASETL
jgi:hypothetical protein